MMLLYLVEVFFFLQNIFRKSRFLDIFKAKPIKRNKNFELNLLSFSLPNF